MRYVGIDRFSLNTHRDVLFFTISFLSRHPVQTQHDAKALTRSSRCDTLTPARTTHILVSTHAQQEPTTLPSSRAAQRYRVRAMVRAGRSETAPGTLPWSNTPAAHASQPLACTPCQAHPPSSLLILAVCRSSRPNHRHAGGTVCAPSSHAATRPRWRRPWPGAPGSIGISGRHDRVAQRRTPPPHRRGARHCAGTAPFSSGVTNSSASSVL